MSLKSYINSIEFRTIHSNIIFMHSSKIAIETLIALNWHVKFNSVLKMDSISLSTEKQSYRDEYMRRRKKAKKQQPPTSKTIGKYQKWKARKMNANPNIQSNKINTVGLVFIDHKGIYTLHSYTVSWSRELSWAELSRAELKWTKLKWTWFHFSYRYH